MPRQDGCCNNAGNMDERRRQAGCCNDTRRPRDRGEERPQGGCCNGPRREVDIDERTVNRGIEYLTRSLSRLKTFQCLILTFYFFNSVVGARPGQALVPILVRKFVAKTWLKPWLMQTGMFDPFPHFRLDIRSWDWRRQIERIPDSVHHLG